MTIPPDLNQNLTGDEVGGGVDGELVAGGREGAVRIDSPEGNDDVSRGGVSLDGDPAVGPSDDGRRGCR